MLLRIWSLWGPVLLWLLRVRSVCLGVGWSVCCLDLRVSLALGLGNLRLEAWVCLGWVMLLQSLLVLVVKGLVQVCVRLLRPRRLVVCPECWGLGCFLVSLLPLVCVWMGLVWCCLLVFLCRRRSVGLCRRLRVFYRCPFRRRCGWLRLRLGGRWRCVRVLV